MLHTPRLSRCPQTVPIKPEAADQTCRSVSGAFARKMAPKTPKLGGGGQVQSGSDEFAAQPFPLFVVFTIPAICPGPLQLRASVPVALWPLRWTRPTRSFATRRLYLPSRSVSQLLHQLARRHQYIVGVPPPARRFAALIAEVRGHRDGVSGGCQPAGAFRSRGPGRARRSPRLGGHAGEGSSLWRNGDRQAHNPGGLARRGGVAAQPHAHVTENGRTCCSCKSGGRMDGDKRTGVQDHTNVDRCAPTCTIFCEANREGQSIW
jgi:hypothetical protein